MMLKASVSGSFHRCMVGIYSAVHELRALGVNVLSPADPRVVDAAGEFLFVASDRLRSVKLVQDRHFEAIRASDFLWVVCPDGYTGPSTSAEIGAAQVLGIPTFSDRRPLDITLRHYVTEASSMRAAIAATSARRSPRSRARAHILLEPDHSVARSIAALEQIGRVLTGRCTEIEHSPEEEVQRGLEIIADTVGISNRQ
jgi:hypothetical protein